MDEKPANFIMEDWEYPGCSPKKHELDTTGLLDVKFGKEMKIKEFFLKPEVAFFNHGSYGTVPRRVMDMQMKYMLEREEHPDFWFRLTAKRYMDKSRQSVADFVGADVENVLLVSNVTTAINTILKSYPFKPGDAVLDTSLNYGSIQNLCADFTSRIRPDVKRVQLELDFPVKKEKYIIQRYQEVLENNPNIKVVILEHITSPTSMLMPLKKLVDLCHQHGSLAVVDGAHAIGQVPLNMRETGADIYTSNLHKWVYGSKSCAFLWFDSRHMDWIRPENTSWQMGLSLDKQFFDQGTRDHIPFICARHSLQFYEAIGGMDEIVGYTSALANTAKEIFTKEFGLEVLQMPESIESPNIKLVKLPPLPKFPVSPDSSWHLHRAMFAETNTFGLLCLISGAYYFRFSIQVYNDVEEVRTIGKVIKDFIDKNS